MNMKLSLTFAAMTTLVAPAAMAATIVIDDFTAPGSIIATLQGNPVPLDVAGPGILGGNRFMWVSTDDGSAPLGSGLSANGSGSVNFSNDAGVTGQAVLVYDGGGAGSAFAFNFDSSPANLIDVDTDGLGGGAGIDFLAGNPAANRSIAFSGANFDTLPSNATFRAYAWDVDGTLVEYDELIGGPDFNSNLGLTSFSTTGGGDGVFDWTKVGAIAFSVESNTPNFDGTLGTISVVPLPASALLLLGGLGGLTAASRRRRKDRKA